MDMKNFSSNETIRDNFMKKYTVNGFDASSNYTKVLEYVTRENNNSYLDHAFWLRDRKIVDIAKMFDYKHTKNTINGVSKDQLFFSTNMIPIFKSILENKGNQTQNSIKQIYMAFESTELYFLYPIQYAPQNNQIYHFFNTSTYPTYCHAPDGETVDYYFFKCQPWWKDILSFKSANNFDISITMPYKYATDNTVGVTLCIRFDDPFDVRDKGVTYTKQNIAICIDSYIDQINFAFDYFSKNLNGYFFVMRLNSDVPIYYPLTNNKIGHSSISNYEFDFNITYFLNELEEFRTTKLDFFKFINFTESEEDNIEKHIIKGKYKKNNLLHQYNVIPVTLFLDENNPTKSTHFFSIILVMTDITGMSLGKASTSLSRIITLIAVLAFFGLILLLIGKYLINALADNIVRPLRSLKFIIQGMNNKQLLEDKEYTKQEEEIDSKVAREDADISFERTHEIEIFGEMIIKLQNVLKFTTNNKNSSDSMALIKYIYSKYSFQEVSNLKGKL